MEANNSSRTVAAMVAGTGVTTAGVMNMAVDMDIPAGIGFQAATIMAAGMAVETTTTTSVAAVAIAALLSISASSHRFGRLKSKSQTTTAILDHLNLVVGPEVDSRAMIEAGRDTGMAMAMEVMVATEDMAAMVDRGVMVATAEVGMAVRMRTRILETRTRITTGTTATTAVEGVAGQGEDVPSCTPAFKRLGPAFRSNDEKSL